MVLLERCFAPRVKEGRTSSISGRLKASSSRGGWLTTDSNSGTTGGSAGMSNSEIAVLQIASVLSYILGDIGRCAVGEAGRSISVGSGVSLWVPSISGKVKRSSSSPSNVCGLTLPSSAG